MNVSVDETDLKAVLAYLNSRVGQQVVQQRTRLRADGYESLGVRALKNLPVIDPRELDNETVVKLAEPFDDLRAAARRDGDTETVRKSIDALLESWTDLQ
jgi:adenine-specific DNA-methyltransferase